LRPPPFFSHIPSNTAGYGPGVDRLSRSPRFSEHPPFDQFSSSGVKFLAGGKITSPSPSFFYSPFTPPGRAALPPADETLELSRRPPREPLVTVQQNVHPVFRGSPPLLDYAFQPLEHLQPVAFFLLWKSTSISFQTLRHRPAGTFSPPLGLYWGLGPFLSGVPMDLVHLVPFSFSPFQFVLPGGGFWFPRPNVAVRVFSKRTPSAPSCHPPPHFPFGFPQRVGVPRALALCFFSHPALCTSLSLSSNLTRAGRFGWIEIDLYWSSFALIFPPFSNLSFVLDGFFWLLFVRSFFLFNRRSFLSGGYSSFFSSPKRFFAGRRRWSGCFDERTPPFFLNNVALSFGTLTVFSFSGPFLGGLVVLQWNAWGRNFSPFPG